MANTKKTPSSRNTSSKKSPSKSDNNDQAKNTGKDIPDAVREDPIPRHGMRIAYHIKVVTADKDIIDIQDSITIHLAEHESLLHRTAQKTAMFLNDAALEPVKFAVNQHVRNLKRRLMQERAEEEEEDDEDMNDSVPALPPIESPEQVDEEGYPTLQEDEDLPDNK